jgi:hypoxanthine phosphoribosyltransferase
MNIQVHDKIFSPYLSETQIKTRIVELGAQLNDFYSNKNPLLLPILNGSFIFAADLVRELTISPDIQFVKISSYGNEMESTKKINSIFGLDNLQIEGQHILIIEDIVDSGFTVDFLMEYLSKKSPASLKVCALLYKPDSFKGKHTPDFIGFTIPSDFVVGYGLDYAQKGRELSSIYVLAET